MRKVGNETIRNPDRASPGPQGQVKALSGLFCRYVLTGNVTLAISRFAPLAPGDQSPLLVAAGLSLAHPKRQAEFLAGRELLQTACGLPSLGRNLEGAPLWPQGMTGALSHSGAWVAAISGANGRLLGVDLETCLAPDRAELLSRRILTLREQGWQKLLCGPDAAQMLTLVFSAKETAYKALSRLVGKRLAFDCAEVEYPPPGRGGRWRMQLTRQLAPDLPQGFVLQGGFLRSGQMTLTWLNQPLKAA